MGLSSGPTLRPLSVADLVDEIFRLYRRNFGLLFSISAFIWLPASILIVAGLAIVGNVVPRAPISLGERIPSQLPLGFSGDPLLGFAVFAVGLVVALVTFPILIAATTEAVASTYLGRPTSITDSLRRGMHCFWRVVGGYLVVAFALVGLIIAVGFATVFLAVAVGGVAGAILAAVGIVSLFVALIWLVVTWSLVAQAVVVEDVGVFAALARSAHVVDSSRWRVIGINLLLALIGAVLFSLPSSFLAVLLAPLPMPEGARIGLSQLVAAFAQALYYPVQLGTITLLYFDLRVRREAFDLSLAAERLSTR